jgi:hypothetical protein
MSTSEIISTMGPMNRVINLLITRSYITQELAGSALIGYVGGEGLAGLMREKILTEYLLSLLFLQHTADLD